MRSSFWKSFIIVHMALLVLVMSWEQQKADAALVSATTAEEGAELIPQDSIRLRILADSDAVADQVLKRRIRDAVIASMDGWVSGPQTLESAREAVQAQLPEIEALVDGMVRQAGFDYTYTVELGVVPFPTKVYGNQVYPAGDYEALRITLGRGLGQNWWCVLFPPLCFVDVAAAEAPKTASAEPEAQADDGEEELKVEYRFLIADLLADAVDSMKRWFMV